MTLGSSRFTMINTGFICAACGHAVPPARGTARNHCPRCLKSLHVDELPGDRAAQCGALMPAIGYEVRGSDRITLIFRCAGCGAVRRNKAVQDGPDADDRAAILKLTPEAPTR